jgi:hypothetical protein
LRFYRRDGRLPASKISEERASLIVIQHAVGVFSGDTGRSQLLQQFFWGDADLLGQFLYGYDRHRYLP